MDQMFSSKKSSESGNMEIFPAVFGPHGGPTDIRSSPSRPTYGDNDSQLHPPLSAHPIKDAWDPVRNTSNPEFPRFDTCSDYKPGMDSEQGLRLRLMTLLSLYDLLPHSISNPPNGQAPSRLEDAIGPQAVQECLDAISRQQPQALPTVLANILVCSFPLFYIS